MSPFESIALIRYRALKLGVELEGVWLNENDTKSLGEWLYRVDCIIDSGQRATMFTLGIIPKPFRLAGLTIHSVKT